MVSGSCKHMYQQFRSHMQAIHKLKESFVAIQATIVSYICKPMDQQEQYASHPNLMTHLLKPQTTICLTSDCFRQIYTMKP